MTTLTPRQIVLELANAAEAHDAWLLQRTRLERHGNVARLVEVRMAIENCERWLAHWREELARTGEVPERCKS